MKTLLALCLLAVSAAAGWCATTIDATHQYAYGANLGWTNWRPSTADGVATGEYVCSGSVWAANVGWINFGSGTPANGIRYQNNSATDFGVNLLADGTLRGFAYGANIGWVNFEATGNPRLNFGNGRLSGYAYGANVGWINLDDGLGDFVATTAIPPGADTDGDGLTDAWELERAGNLTALSATGDADGDGLSDLAEYLADTNPLDGTDRLRITDFALTSDTTMIALTWTSRLTRRYHIESRPDLTTGSWAESVLGTVAPDSNVTTARVLAEPAAAQRFYRIRAARPLAP